MASETINVILRLVTGQYKTEAREAATATGGIGAAARTTGGGLTSLTRNFGLIKGAFAAAGIAAIAGQLRDMAQAAIEDAEAQEILAGALRTNTGATDGQIAANERWISSMQIATRTADNDLRQALTDLTVTGRGLEDAQNDIAIATDIAASKGIELSTVIKALVRAQASGSTGGLARLGIDTKNAAGEMLTYDEVLQQAAKTMGGTAARAAGTLAGALERSKIAMQEAREEAGANFAPTMIEITDLWNEFVTSALGGNTKLAGLQTVFNSLITNGVDPFEDAVASAGFTLAEFSRQFREDIDLQTFDTLVKMLGLTSDQVLELRRNFIQNGDAVVEHKDDLKAIIGVLDSYVGNVDPAILATRRFRQAQTDAAGGTRDHTEALQAQRDLLREMTDPLFALISANERYEDAQRRLNDAAIEGGTNSDIYRDALADLLLAQRDVNQAQADANTTSREGLDLLEQLAIQAGVNMKAFDLWRASVDLLAGSISNIPATVGGRPTVTSGGSVNIRGAFHRGGVVPGPAGSDQLILAQAGEMVIPRNHVQQMTRNGPTIVVNSPTNNLPQDLQYAALLANVATLN